MNGYQPPFIYFGGKSSIASEIWDVLGDPPNYVEPFCGSAAVLLLGSGWCSGQGPWVEENGRMVKLPHLGDAGRGVNRKLPHLGDAGRGVNRKRPHLGNAGRGVNRQLPHLGTAGRGVNRKRPHREWLVGYLRSFADRLRNVRICCGDWNRVCGPTPTFKQGITGVFLDPPYADTAGRSSDIYAVDCEQVAHSVREWAISNGNNPLMRIVLCGYQDEHAMPDNWRTIEWKSHGGYGSQGEGTGRENSNRERLWCSPHCRQPHRSLFA